MIQGSNADGLEDIQKPRIRSDIQSTSSAPLAQFISKPNRPTKAKAAHSHRSVRPGVRSTLMSPALINSAEVPPRAKNTPTATDSRPSDTPFRPRPFTCPPPPLQLPRP